MNKSAKKTQNALDFYRKYCRIGAELHISLIKSGGGNGPMKPGNLIIKVPNPAATKDEDSIKRTSSLRCAVFCVFTERIKRWKKDCLRQNA